MLLHLPGRLTALRQMACSLRPGGWLVLDEFDARYSPVLLAPSEQAANQYARFIESKVTVMESAGADMSWGQRVAGAMREAGLVNIEIRPHLLPFRGGSPGAQLQAHHTWHLRDKFLRAGVTDAAWSSRNLVQLAAECSDVDPGSRACLRVVDADECDAIAPRSPCVMSPQSAQAPAPDLCDLPE